VSFVLLGEPATGKSSLLVALYGALVNHGAGDLRLVRTVDEVQFLSRGLEAFGRQESLPRTDVGSSARLSVEVALGEAIMGLEVPDRSGEILKQMLDARAWEPDLREQIGLAAGAMLFLRADRYDPGEDSEEVAQLLGPGADDEPGRNDSDPVPWTPALMPSDVRTVDLLQAVLNERDNAIPVAIIISAWDRVSHPPPAPPEWLARHMPLLDQFLASHAQALPHAVFGVSAQGGDFSVGLAEDLADVDPWDRAFVVRSDATLGTVAEPVLWLFDTST
jgi:Double-GTPase 1